VAFDAGPNCIAWSEEVLAVGGRGGKPNRRQVRLYSVKQDFEVLTTLEVPAITGESRAHSLAMSPDGTKLAVGLCESSREEVAIFSSANGWGDPPLLLANPQPESQYCCSTAFSPDGRYLCAGYHPSYQFAIWDVEAAVCIRVIPTKGNDHVCAFSPAGDLLATGGDEGNPVVVHELLPLRPLATFALPGEAAQPISAACASDRLVVLASGKRLAALRRPDGTVLWQTDLEEAAFAWNATMALRPTGDQVAICVYKAKAVSVRDTRTGNELYALKELNSFYLVKYSPDGSLLVVVKRGPECTKVYEAATGKELHSFEGKGGYHADIDPSNTFLAATGPPGTNTMISLESGEEVLALEKGNHMHGGVFNDAGDRMVFGLDNGSEAIVGEKLDGVWRETQRWAKPDGVRWTINAEFSPGDGRYLLLVCRNDGDEARRGRIALLDTETGQEPA
jgi:WD40 repeat protein